MSNEKTVKQKHRVCFPSSSVVKPDEGASNIVVNLTLLCIFGLTFCLILSKCSN